NKKQLAQMAKEHGIIGWHAMRKDQLIRALTAARSSSKKGSGKAAAAAPAQTRGAANTKRPASRAALAAADAAVARRKGNSAGASAEKMTPLAPPSRPLPVMPPRALEHVCVKDRIIAMVRDPYWLHVYWELSRSTYARAQAALGQEWHTARPILRLMDVT